MIQPAFSRFNLRQFVGAQRSVGLAVLVAACVIAPLAQPAVAERHRPTLAKPVAVRSQPANPAATTGDRCQQTDRQLQRLYSFQDGDLTITICQQGQRYVYVQTRDR
jgi:hypothetical protein